jgi:hypothetical protein
MGKKNANRLIFLLLIIFILRGLIFSQITPFSRIPGERECFNRIKYIEGRIKEVDKPLNKDSVKNFLEISDRNGGSIYYLITYLWMGLFRPYNDNSKLHMLRLLSIILHTGIILISFIIIRELFPENQSLIYTLPAIITFNPQYTALSVGVNSNILGEVILSSMLFLYIRTFKYGLSINRIILMLTFLIASLYSTNSVFHLLFLLTTIFIITYFGKDIKNIIFKSLLLTFILIIIGMIYFYIIAPGNRFIDNISILKYFDIIKIERYEFLIKNLLIYYGDIRLKFHYIWYLIIFILSLISLTGIILLFKKEKNVFIKKSIFILSGATLLSFLFLLPPIIPVSFLFTIGISNIYNRALPLIIIFFIIFDLIGITEYIIPNFYNVSF